MAKNILTPEQDLLTREFFLAVAAKADGLLISNPAYARQLRAIVLLLLNYQPGPDGGFIEKGTVLHRSLSGKSQGKVEDEWPADAAAAQKAFDNEANNDPNTSEASTGESSEDTPIRQTLLPEDLS